MVIFLGELKFLGELVKSPRNRINLPKILTHLNFSTHLKWSLSYLNVILKLPKIQCRVCDVSSLRAHSCPMIKGRTSSHNVVIRGSHTVGSQSADGAAVKARLDNEKLSRVYRGGWIYDRNTAHAFCQWTFLYRRLEKPISDLRLVPSIQLPNNV